MSRYPISNLMAAIVQISLFFHQSSEQHCVDSFISYVSVFDEDLSVSGMLFLCRELRFCCHVADHLGIQPIPTL